MPRHGWYEWHPDPRDERFDLHDELEDAEALRLALQWCESCDRGAPPEGCPACGEDES